MRGAPDGRHCATPIRPPTPRRPAHPKGTIGRPGPAQRPHTDRSWPPRSPGGAGVSFRPSTRVVYEEKAISQAPGFLDDPEGLREVLDVVDRLAEEPRPAGSFPYGSPDLRRLRAGGWSPRRQRSLASVQGRVIRHTFPRTAGTPRLARAAGTGPRARSHL